VEAAQAMERMKATKVKDESVAVETLFLFHPSAFNLSIACAARP
jgi:hypothetical protein